MANVLDRIIGSGSATSGGIITALVTLALLVPSLAVGVRRLHDTGRSAWWWLIVLIPIVGAILLIVCVGRDSKPATSTDRRPRRSKVVTLRFPRRRRSSEPFRPSLGATPSVPTAPVRVSGGARGSRLDRTPPRPQGRPRGEGPVSFQEAVRICLQQRYAEFSGRSRRSEFWFFVLFSAIVRTIANVVDAILHTNYANNVAASSRLWSSWRWSFPRSRSASAGCMTPAAAAGGS